MGLCASAVEANQQQIVPVHHLSEEEREKKIQAAEEEDVEHCVGCMEAFPKDELEISACCGHEVCKDCKASEGRNLCKACSHNVKAGAEYAKVKPREDTRGVVVDENVDMGGAALLGAVAVSAAMSDDPRELFEDIGDHIHLHPGLFSQHTEKNNIFGEMCIMCNEHCNRRTFKSPECCNRSMCPTCALGEDVEDSKCKLCEKEAKQHDDNI
jgi:hypothetical protein